jgi:hypothetical protein
MNHCNNVTRLIEAVQQGDSAAAEEIKRIAYLADEGQRLVPLLTERLKIMHEMNVSMREQISQIKALIKNT